jgi:hypothetical protein
VAVSWNSTVKLDTTYTRCRSVHKAVLTLYRLRKSMVRVLRSRHDSGQSYIVGVHEGLKTTQI